jgi:hypothetical protein
LLACTKAAVQFQELHQIDDRRFPLNLSRSSSASFLRIPSTSACEIGFEGAAAVGAPADGAAVADGGALGDGGAPGDGAPVVPADDGAVEDGPPAVVTLAACLEPKIADTMLPKTLIVSLLS